jgi:hypothetical protein
MEPVHILVLFDHDALSSQDDVFADSLGADDSRLTSNDLRPSSASTQSMDVLPSPIAVPEDGPAQQLIQRSARSPGIRDRSDIASFRFFFSCCL